MRSAPIILTCCSAIAMSSVATAQTPEAGGHADLCVVGEFYRAARDRRVSMLLITDSNGINADGPGAYGYVYGLHDAAFEDAEYECWATGLFSGSFTQSANPVFTVSAGSPVSIGDPVVSGFASAYRGTGSVNGNYYSVRNGFSAGAMASAGIRSVQGYQAPSWFRWDEFPLTVHFTTFLSAAAGNGTLQLQLAQDEEPILIGPKIATNDGDEDTVVDAAIEAEAGELPRGLGQRLALVSKGITGQAVWNYIIPEAPDRRTGFHISQLWVESGGRAVDAASDLASASPEHIDKVFERLSTVQDEDEPMLIVQLVVGGNDWGNVSGPASVTNAIESMRARCEDAWLAAGNTPESIVFLLVGYHPRAEHPNYGFRDELREYALETPRVAFYDPAAEFSIRDMINGGYSDNNVTGSDAHMSDAGYRALALRQLGVIEEAGRPSASDLNLDGRVDSADLGLIIATFGAPYGFADLNDDGVVNAPDLGHLLADFGKEPCVEGE